MSSTIDVIIPVFRGESESRACLESVLASGAERAHELVVIDDAGPEEGLRAWLRELAEARRITLVTHAANRGFVASVNEGMRLHPDRDVVLLNSDTEVATGWLDRLARHASAAGVATVTPFSNNATLCSYPDALAANAIPPGETVATLDAAFARANAGDAVEIPTAVGFCMYVARAALDRVGPFDEARYGTGYGEEVDFCMRAARAGLRHLLAADVFVRHVGEVSFGDAGAARRLHAQATIDALYPEFQERLREHLARDPARVFRRRADLARLQASRRPRLLFLRHNRRGGVERHVTELAGALASGAEVLQLAPYRKSFVELSWLRAGEAMRLWFHVRDDWEQLVALLRAIGISRAHLHHVHGLPQSVLELPRRLGCAWDVTLHDYFPLCPQYQLTDASKTYCREQGADGCMKCLELGPAQWPMTIEEWRAAFRAFLAGASRVIAPSHDAAERLRRYFPEIAVRVWPHPERAEAPRISPRRILVIGAISPAKGFEVLRACARDAAARGLPLHFRVLGSIALPLAPWPELPLTFTGEYPEGALDELIALERGDAVLFAAQWPETWSYTLSAAIDSGLPIVALDLGAFRERLETSGPPHRLIDWQSPPQAINDALLEVAVAPATHPASAGESRSFEVYVSRYLEGIETPAVMRAPLPTVPPAWLTEPAEPVPQATLLELYDDGILCGNGASMRELRGRLQAADRALAQAGTTEEQSRELAEARTALAALRERLVRAEAAAERAEAGARTAKAEASALRGSTSWRITAPLRALARLVGRV